MPDGWRWERLDAVSPVNPRRNFDGIADDAQLAFLGMAAVAELTGALDLTEQRSMASVRSGFTRFRSGDVIFAKITPCMENGKLAVIPDLPHGMGAGSTEFHVLEPQQVSARYLLHWLSQQTFRNRAEHNMTGTAGQKRVPTDWLRNAPIPVPPKAAEQNAIIARIDALFAEIDEGEAALAKARAGVETYRKALLKAAVTGELTADWRQANPPQETGEQLLQRILADRRARWQADPRNARKKYVEPAGPDTGSLPKLPGGWTWASMEQLTVQIRNGLSTKPTEQVGGVPILRISAVRPFEIVPNQMRLLPPGTDVRGFQVCRGDLIATRYSGSPQFVGVVAKFRDAVSIAYPDKLIRLQMWTDDQWLTDFVEIAANCWQSRRFIEDNIKTTAGQHGIAGGSLAMAPIPVPPREEASEIMRRVRQALGTITADIGINQLEGTVATLRQSILAAAFRGELAA